MMTIDSLSFALTFIDYIWGLNFEEIEVKIIGVARDKCVYHKIATLGIVNSFYIPILKVY